jgi:predicted N-acetyltransferase YhbS
LRPNIRKFDVHGDENLPDIRETVESATRADLVTVIRRDRMRVFEDGLVRRRDCERNAITQIAMWRIRCKPEQQRAE